MNDAEIAIGLSNVVAVSNRFEVRLHRLRIVFIIQHQRFFKWGPQSRDSGLTRSTEQTQLSLKLCLDLANAVALRAQFANSPKLSQRLEVVAEFVRVGGGRALDDALFGPATDRAFTQSEELFDFANGILCLNALVVSLRGNT